VTGLFCGGLIAVALSVNIREVAGGIVVNGSSSTI
jgi:hypothetical protein